MRKVEFAVTQDMFLTTGARYSDLVLPVTSRWERAGYTAIPNREAAFWASQVIDPLFETKDDDWIDWQLGLRLGVYDEANPEISLAQQLFNQVAGATVVKEDGVTTEPLVTITQADLDALGVEGTPQTGRIPIMEFKEAGSYQVPRHEGDNFGYIALKDFREDPEANPLSTATGLSRTAQPEHWLTTSLRLAGRPSARSRHTSRRSAATKTTFSDWENKVKGEYPLQMYNKHYWRRSHSEFDNVSAAS